jgi:hypothetical protein
VTGQSAAADAAHAGVFDFEELLDAVFGAFAPDTAFLHRAELDTVGEHSASQ